MNKYQLILYGLPMPTLARWIIAETKPHLESWADIGSGNGEVLKDITIKPKKGIMIDVTLNEIDGFSAYRGTADDFFKENNNFNDLVSLFDVIEHFHKEEALELLNNLNNRFNEQIIFTPDGFLKQDRETHLEYDNNPYQWHKCGFTFEEFNSLGYYVFILKNYHVYSKGHKKNFNAILAFINNNFDKMDYQNLRKKIKSNYRHWIFHKTHLLSVLKTILRRNSHLTV